MKNPVWVVKEVEPKKDYTLHLTFEDGSKKIYNARHLLEKRLFEKLKNPTFFLRARVENGSVVWSDEIDIDPEVLYYNSFTC